MATVGTLFLPSAEMRFRIFRTPAMPIMDFVSSFLEQDQKTDDSTQSEDLIVTYVGVA